MVAPSSATVPAVSISSAVPVLSSTSVPVPPASVAPVLPPPLPAATLTMLHPMENQRLPPLTQVFAYGQTVPGSTLTINGLPVPVHRKGGYLVMVPLTPGENTLHEETRSPHGAMATLDRHVFVSSGFVVSPYPPLTLERGSITPDDNQELVAGDTLRVTAQGSPGGTAEFTVSGLHMHAPMLEADAGTPQARGIYRGSYVIQPDDKTTSGAIEVSLKRELHQAHQTAAGHLTIRATDIPRVGQVLDDIAAVRTAPEGGYDFFIYKGMKVQLTGQRDGQWHVRFAQTQEGWVKLNAIQELPAGALPPSSGVTNFTVTHLSESTLIRIPLGEALPWRAEQSIDPTRLTVTLYGANDRTNLIHYDVSDPLIRLIQWKQVGADATQIIITPSFKRWWGYDVRYEGATLIIEVRAPWTKGLRGLPIAIDPGHGGSDTGAVGPLGTLEKNTNLAIAKVVVEALRVAGAKPFLTRDRDIDVPLIERGRIAWRGGARVFISVHGNASGVEENPLWNNGFSVYFYHPQSAALARAVHRHYRQSLINVPDHGLYYDDLSVCRSFQMPAILTEQAFLIIPEQEQLLLSPRFHHAVARAIVNGLREWLTE